MHHQPATLTAAFHALAPGLMTSKGPGYSSALYKQTGHFVTGNEIGYLFLAIIAVVVVGFLISTLRSS